MFDCCFHPRHLRFLLSAGGGVVLRVVVCGVLLVVTCVVLFVLCVCVCDLFLFLPETWQSCVNGDCEGDIFFI